MTCYVTYDGTIKLDGYVVGKVYQDPVANEPDALVWRWAAKVNGRCIDSGGWRSVRWYAFDCARKHVEHEAAVIR